MGEQVKQDASLPSNIVPAILSENNPHISRTVVAVNESDSSDWLSQSVASSTSWSDELDADATKTLLEQWNLVENTLYRDGDRQLPAKSPLREECRLWQKHFPHLRILGESVRPSVGCQTRSRHEEAEEQIDEIIAAHGEYDVDSSNKTLPIKGKALDSEEIYKEKLKKAVIDQIFARIWPDVIKKIEPILRRAVDSRKDIFSDTPELKWKCNDRFDDEVTQEFNSLSITEDYTLTNVKAKSGRSVLSATKHNDRFDDKVTCELIAKDFSLASVKPRLGKSILCATTCSDRFDDERTRDFNSLSITEDFSLTNVKPRSGRSLLSDKKCSDRFDDERTREFNSLSITEDFSLTNVRQKSGRSVFSATKCSDRFNDEGTREFNSLSIAEDVLLTNVRPRSGRSVLSARKDNSAVVPVKPLVLECSIPLPTSATVRISSALRRSPAKLSHPSLSSKHPSSERLLSPLVLQQEVKMPLKSAGSKKSKANERKNDVKHYPQYDAKTGRMISRDDSRSGSRRNLKTSPPVHLSRPVTLPPIENCEIIPKCMQSTRSTSAFLRGGRLSCSSRPNTTLTSKARCSS